MNTIRLLLLGLLVLVLLPTLSAQNQASFFKVLPTDISDAPAWAQLMYSPNPNVEAVHDAYQAYYRDHDFVKTIHTQNYRYWTQNTKDLVQSDGSILAPTPDEYQAQWQALQQWRSAQESNQTEDALWEMAGPYETFKNDGSMELRLTQTNVQSIAVAPSNTDILYCGADTGGGIFKSTDHGLSWTLVSRDYPITSAHDIKIHPTNPDIVYLSNGDKIWKTSDAGATWTQIYDAAGTVEQFYIHPVMPEWVFAATSEGLLRSTDNGDAWENIFDERCWDIQAHATNPDILYLSISNPALKRAEIYKSVNTGADWTLLDNGWYVPADPVNAIDHGCKIGVTPADPDRVYAGLIGDSKPGDNGWIGIYYSLDGGASWVNADGIDGGPYVSGNDMNTNWFVAGYSSGYHQGWYNFDLDVSHNDPDRLWVGTIWSCESANRGANIEYIRGTRSLEMHADVQDIDVVGDEIWYTSDGGINYSNDEMQSVEVRHYGITASTYWGFSQGWNEDTWTGGRYHNGDAVFLESYGSGNTMFLGGAESATGYINPLDNRMAHFSDIADKRVPDFLDQASTDIANFSLYPNQSYVTLNSSEVEYHPNYSNYVYLGNENHFYRSTDGGASFEALFSFPESGYVLEFEISRENPDIIYCLVRDNGSCTLYKSFNGGAIFSPVNAIPSNNISRLDLTLDPADANHIWVASQYGANGQKVYASTDGGNSWQNKTTEMLDGQNVFDILYQAGTEQVVYLATTNAVFYWDAEQEDWQMYADGLPLQVRPLKMIPFYRDAKLRLAGDRGVWEAPLAVNSQASAEPMTTDAIVYCSRDTVQLEDHSILHHAGASWAWEISPEPSYVSDYQARNPRVVFGENGTYSITLTVTDGTGNTSSKTVEQMVALQNQCEPEQVPGLAMQCAGNNQHANIPDLGISQTNTVTISAWIKPAGPQNDYSGIVINDGATGGLNISTGNQLGYHWPGGAWWWNSNLTIIEQEWQHVALVATPTSLTIYLNGESATHLTNLEPIDLGTMKIGSYKGWTSRNFQGEIDEVAIWNRSLSEEEIRMIRHLTRTGPQAFDEDLIAYYQFNLPGTTQVMDRRGNRHATLTGNAEKVLSSAPLGGGESALLSIDGAGIYDFGDPEVQLEVEGNPPFGPVVVSRINLLPNETPNANSSPENYWVINNYGSTVISPFSKVSLKPKPGAPSGNIEQARLFWRPENADLNNWEEQCGVQGVLNGAYQFNAFCGVDQSGQYFIQSANSDEIFTQYETGEQTVTICEGESYFVGGDWQTEAGVYVDTVDIAFQLDSIISTTLEVIPCTGTQELEVLGINVFPNPGNGLFQLTSSGHETLTACSVYFASGAKLREVSVGRAATITTIDLRAQAAGVYFARLQVGEQVRWIRLVKK